MSDPPPLTLYTARWVLPIHRGPILDGGVVVDRGTIAAVGTRRDLTSEFLNDPAGRAAENVELGECALLPGFVNVHTHLELSLLRGICEDVDFFAWIRKLTTIKYEVLREDDYRLAACWGALEAIQNGVTTVGDASDQGVVLDALLDSGLRGVVFQEVFGPDPDLCDRQVAELQERVTAMQARATDRVRIGVSPHAPYTVSAPLFVATMELAAKSSLPVSIHIAESQAECEFLRDGTGPFADYLRGRSIDVLPQSVSPVGYLQRLGVLAHRPLLVHAVQVGAGDLDRLQELDVPLAHCPKSNAKLGHGVAPFTEMLGRGLRIGLGTDGTVSNNSCDLLSEARFATLQQRARSELTPEERRLLAARRMLRAATLGGAEALSLDSQVGSLEVGKRADLIAVDLSGPRHAPVGDDPEAALVFAASGADVRLTVVDGVPLYLRGHALTLDAAALAAEVSSRRSALERRKERTSR